MASDPVRGSFSEPLVVEPLLGSLHKQTFILLHGRGSSAAKFGPTLLQTPFLLPLPLPENGQHQQPSSSSSKCDTEDGAGQHKDITTLAAAFPHARFVFPTAPRGRATIYKRSLVRQWFDSWHVDSPRHAAAAAVHEGMMVDGLQQTVGYLHGLVRREMALVGGAQNVVLGGLSQGCAASLVALLLWDGEPLAAAVGMCGWLPFMSHLLNPKDAERSRMGSEEGVATDCSDDDEEEQELETGESGGGSVDEYDERNNDDNIDEKDEEYEEDEEDLEDEEDEDGRHEDHGTCWEDDFDPFAHSGDEGGLSIPPAKVSDPAVAAVRTLQEKLELGGQIPERRPWVFNTLLFFGHGDRDEKVHVSLARGAAECLNGLGLDVAWNEYRGLGHWYSDAMLADLVCFLKNKSRWDEGEKNQP
ncbi:Alpha/Beta hydrolase protein [Lasiosphaeria ovina]|uniref:Alpha/Beta hydrolase protein n=1 Tax=Lasiosphaeria ovina TaxID=92902 RepID=A0AAE0JY21_9PEZI|nr:Alpha/Beta hydrolase protein [Lasiosphaeria ovina]